MGSATTRTLGSDLRVATGCALTLGLSSSVGDWIWARYIPDGAVLPGVVHGLAIFVILAVVLAAAAGSMRVLRRLLPTLPVAGLVLAAAFYPIASIVGYLAGLLISWIGMWLSLALLQRWARDRPEDAVRSLLRGLAAAALSGVAFWGVSGMWTDPDPSRNYALRWLAWSFAFWPGFAALLARQAVARPSS